MSYSAQYICAVVVGCLALIIAGIQVSDPSRLAISPVLVAWATVVSPCLTLLAGILPSLRRPPVDVDDSGPASNPDPMPRDSK